MSAMNSNSRAAFRELSHVLFAVGGIVFLFLNGLLSFGDGPLMNFMSLNAFLDGCYRLLKAAVLIGAAYALTRMWIEKQESEQELGFLRRQFSEREGERNSRSSPAGSRSRFQCTCNSGLYSCDVTGSAATDEVTGGVLKRQIE
jgi:hypothetical protein